MSQQKPGNGQGWRTGAETTLPQRVQARERPKRSYLTSARDSRWCFGSSPSFKISIFFFFFLGQFLEGLIIKTGVLQLTSALLLQWQCVNMNEVKDMAGGGQGQQHGEVKGVMERRICVD